MIWTSGYIFDSAASGDTDAVDPAEGQGDGSEGESGGNTTAGIAAIALLLGSAAALSRKNKADAEGKEADKDSKKESKSEPEKDAKKDSEKDTKSDSKK